MLQKTPPKAPKKQNKQNYNSPVKVSDLRTSIIESCQRVQCSALGVETYDVLHDFWVFAPVQGLQVVGSHYVNLLLSGYIGKEADFLCVTWLQQGLHCLKTKTQAWSKTTHMNFNVRKTIVTYHIIQNKITLLLYFWTKWILWNVSSWKIPMCI